MVVVQIKKRGGWMSKIKVIVPISSQEFSELMDGNEFEWNIKAENSNEKVLIKITLDKSGDFDYEN